MYVHGLFGLHATLVVSIGLIKQFCVTSWSKAAIVSILSIIVLAIVAVVLAFLGVGVLIGFGRLF